MLTYFKLQSEFDMYIYYTFSPEIFRKYFEISYMIFQFLTFEDSIIYFDTCRFKEQQRGVKHPDSKTKYCEGSSTLAIILALFMVVFAVYSCVCTYL